MKFEQWMEAEGFSKSVISKYSDAIEGPLSLWAELQNFRNGPISSVVELEAFNQLAEKIEATDDFKVRNKRCQDIYRTVLDKYREFLSQQTTSH